METEEYRQELDPELERLLDERNYTEKLEMLTNMRSRLTKEMIRTICITHDIQLNAEDLQEQYSELCEYMRVMGKYEGNRLR
jgi:Cdc6-like AAA superfamily ATPase